MPRARLLTAMVAATALLVACRASEEDPRGTSSEEALEGPRVPDPTHRYPTGASEPSAPSADPDPSGAALRITCEGAKPFVCTLSDGTFECSDVPCVPSCDRVGCVGGDTCLPCDGGYRCVAPGDRC